MGFVRVLFFKFVSWKKLTICTVGYKRQINSAGAVSEIRVSAKKQAQLTFVLPRAESMYPTCSLQSFGFAGYEGKKGSV